MELLWLMIGFVIGLLVPIFFLLRLLVRSRYNLRWVLLVCVSLGLMLGSALAIGRRLNRELQFPDHGVILAVEPQPSGEIKLQVDLFDRPILYELVEHGTPVTIDGAPAPPTALRPGMNVELILGRRGVQPYVHARPTPATD